MHTTYCDGECSAEDMVKTAIELGLDTVGLSGHSFTPHDTTYCMSRAGTAEYIREVSALKHKYAEKIRVLLGIEMDYYADTDPSPFDYIIGSVHYLFTDEGRDIRNRILTAHETKDRAVSDAEMPGSLVKYEDWCDVDDTAFDLVLFASELGCSMQDIAGSFYSTAGDIVRQTDCDIVGHFDLITKFNERFCIAPDGSVTDIRTDAVRDAKERLNAETVTRERLKDAGFRKLFDTNDPDYIRAWKAAIDRIFEDCRLRYREGRINRLEKLGLLTAGDKPVFEINYGAIARGYRTSPYPASDQIEYIRSKGGILIKSSDAHSTVTLSAGLLS